MSAFATRLALLLAIACLAPPAAAAPASQKAGWRAQCAAASRCNASVRSPSAQRDAAYGAQLRISRVAGDAHQFVLTSSRAAPAPGAAIEVAVDGTRIAQLVPPRDYRPLSSGGTLLIAPAAAQRLLAPMRAGQRIVFAFRSTRGETVQLALSLRGFARAARTIGLTATTQSATTPSAEPTAPAPFPAEREAPAQPARSPAGPDTGAAPPVPPTGRARAPAAGPASERPTADRSTPERATADRATADRSTSDRSTADRATADRPVAERPTAERPAGRTRAKRPAIPSLEGPSLPDEPAEDAAPESAPGAATVAGEQAPSPTRVTTGETVLATLRSRGPDDWTRFLPELLPAIGTCLERTPGSGLHVTKAWPMTGGMAGVRTRNATMGWFDCVAAQAGHRVERFAAVSKEIGRAPGEDVVLFTPALGQPPEGRCYRNERVIDDHKEVVGWLSRNLCRDTATPGRR